MHLLLLSMLLLSSSTAFSQQSTSDFKIDTSKVAVLPAAEYVSKPVQATITDDEIQLAEKIVGEAFEKMSSEFKNSECQPVSYMSLYKRQYFPVMENDQKIFYVNCFVDNKNEFPFWKKYSVFFTGGGLVSIKLNLSKKECTSFRISRPCFSRLKIFTPTNNVNSL